MRVARGNFLKLFVSFFILERVEQRQGAFKRLLGPSRTGNGEGYGPQLFIGVHCVLMVVSCEQ